MLVACTALSSVYLMRTHGMLCGFHNLSSGDTGQSVSYKYNNHIWLHLPIEYGQSSESSLCVFNIRCLNKTSWWCSRHHSDLLFL